MNPGEWEDSDMEFVTSLWNNSSNFAQAFFSMQDQAQGFSMMPIKDEDTSLNFHSHFHMGNGQQPFGSEGFSTMAHQDTSSTALDIANAQAQSRGVSTPFLSGSPNGPSQFSFGQHTPPAASPLNFVDEKRPFFQGSFQSSSSPSSRSWNAGPLAIDVIIDEQPPVEVRTRTPGENRTFGLKAVVVGDFSAKDIQAVGVHLTYANLRNATRPKQSILGGSKVVPIQEDGMIAFENLSMAEASTKHEEREFALEFYFVLSNGQEVSSERRTTPFYAYSHKKVLTRRKNVTLRALSRSNGSMMGGGEIHIVGNPFIKGPALRCLFKTPHGDVELKFSEGQIERYSETVLFFELPPYPQKELNNLLPEGTEIKTEVFVTNDGRHFSNPLQFIYSSGRNSRVRF
eukprot:TRINITY_DN605_c0_g1_i1.p1 TRINITY_DN605_c0_g1~~TRINITY_DN605_c0_g1_i1.p1  ORF type:complete len:434 (-),score=182.42 TRINITY_DN605_c0_g1_i1:321-1520(-)